MMLLVDVSASRMFGTTERLKKNIITEIAAVLAFSAAQNNDKVGVHLLFGQGREVHPPEEGAQPHPHDYPRAHRLPPRIRGHEALRAGALPDQREQEALHDLHPLGLHGLLAGPLGPRRRAEDRRRTARPGGHPHLRPARDGAARRGHRRACATPRRGARSGWTPPRAPCASTTPNRGDGAAPASSRRSSTTVSTRRRSPPTGTTWPN